jgi:hypothetical protein
MRWYWKLVLQRNYRPVRQCTLCLLHSLDTDESCKEQADCCEATYLQVKPTKQPHEHETKEKPGA